LDVGEEEIQVKDTKEEGLRRAWLKVSRKECDK
jgi:hypothetical protein